MVKVKNRPFAITVGILVILTVILIGATYIGKRNLENGEENIVLYIGDYKITEDEYIMLAKENCNQVYMQFTSDQINSEDFWENEIDGITPYKMLDDIILEKLKENYALKILAKELKVEDYDTYEELVESMETYNVSDEKYGLESYDIESYYTYYYSNLETKVREMLIKNEIQITEEECLEYYKNNSDVYISDIVVDILYAEVDACEKNAWNTAYQAARAMESIESIDDINEETFPDVTVEEVQLSSLETQEGMSGIYSMRWEIASQLQAKEVYGPYKDNDVYCVIKCLEKKEKQTIEFSDCVGKIERELQLREADRLIQEQELKLTIEIEKSALKIILKNFK